MTCNHEEVHDQYCCDCSVLIALNHHHGDEDGLMCGQQEMIKIGAEKYQCIDCKYIERLKVALED